jgi:uncharacterized membrane protein
MESKMKVAGHGLHPILIVFPLGLFSTAVLFDLIRIVHGGAGLGEAAFYDIAVGIVMGLVAAVAGLVDWLGIPSGTRARAIGLWHGAGNVVIVVVFAISWIIRVQDPGSPAVIAFVLSLAGALLALATGWLGGELVQRLGVGVDEGANLDASSSLAGEPHRRAVE